MKLINDLTKNVQHLMLDMQQMKVFCQDPLIIQEAKGIYLTDIHGKRYLDGVSGIYVVNIGHGNEQNLPIALGAIYTLDCTNKEEMNGTLEIVFDDT